MFVSRCLDVVVMYVAVHSAELYSYFSTVFFESCLLFVKCDEAYCLN